MSVSEVLTSNAVVKTVCVVCLLGDSRSAADSIICDHHPRLGCTIEVIMRASSSAIRFRYAFVGVVLAIGAGSVHPARGQAPAQTFEVISVKPTAPGGRGVNVQFLP